VQGLKQLVVGEEQVLMQTGNALSQCIKSVSKSGASFIGSTEAVECHRLLLVASMSAQSPLFALSHKMEPYDILHNFIETVWLLMIYAGDNHYSVAY